MFKEKKKKLFDWQLLVENMPIAVMTTRVSDFIIDYVNPKSIELLGGIAHVLPIAPEELLGASIDVFHKAPEHQRKLLADPKNLPHSAVIEIGGEYLDLNISAIFSDDGKYTHAMLSWSIITDKIKKDEQTKRLEQMIDEMPINVMTCDLDFNINFVNKTSLDTLRTVGDYLPIKVDDLLGSSIDVFHKAPEHQRKMLADPSNLPHSAKIKLGPETLRLDVSVVNDANGDYIGPMLCWSVITANVTMAASVSEVVNSMSGTSTEMAASAEQLVALASRGEELAGSVSAAAEQMTSSIKEISTRITEASKMSQDASDQTDETDILVGTLDEAASKVGNITQVINEIADKTNLLALNATIEAARAGEAGKGFAVVAAEVKDLAKQTADATTEIQQQIGSIQSVAKATVEAIGAIGKTIRELSEIATHVAAAVEEQSATTAEVNSNIIGVSDSSKATGQAASDVSQVAIHISEFSEKLNREIEDFIEKN